MAKDTKKTAEDDSSEPETGVEVPGTGVPMVAVSPGEELSGDGTGEALPPAEETPPAKPVTRPRPKYCARPNCGLRPEPGSQTCAHDRGWTP